MRGDELLSIKETLYILLWLIHDKHGEYQMRSYLPKHEVEAIVRAFYPSIVAFFETEVGKHEFEEWKAKKEENLHSKGSKVL